ncbi:uncharacterized protein TNCV_3365551 [Trichonephila clavipes]|nr:uncharacterized protein TNCV_3365551 [Trichonephila clavipes]
MEAVLAFRIFERSLIKQDLQYTKYYGDGDSKGFLKVKDIYGENSVTKLECIGHIQKRIGSRLRKLKKNTKELDGKGKLTDKFIDKLQNYYEISICSNVGCLEKMQSAVLTAFFHCCSSNQNPIHGQCQTGKDSWCKYKQVLSDGDNRLVSGPDYMGDAFKLPNQFPRGSVELQQKCCPDGTEYLFFWPIGAISAQSLTSNCPVVDSRYLNLVFGHADASPNK